jgi:glycosyltransferase involved in cell wall biosynthesis
MNDERSQLRSYPRQAAPGETRGDINVAYVTIYGSSDIRAWSGTGYHILHALQTAGLQTRSIENLRDPYGLLTKAKKAVYMGLAKAYLRDREPLSLKAYASQVRKGLASMACDVALSPSTLPIAYLRTDKPIVFWTDATFAGMLDFYPSFSNLCGETVRNGHRVEQMALSVSRLAIYSSEWAARTAIQHYDVDPNKVKVVPFGANIDCHRDPVDIRRLADDKELDRCKLLFVGVEWLRKGGDIALAVAQALNRRGLRTELHVVGCRPPHGVPSFVKLHGYVSKKTETGRAMLDRLFRESHFLIVPSRAECCAVVYAEASSFGLPSLASDVGGNATAVRDGRNGRAFALDADPERYADYVMESMSSRQAYTAMALSSFEEYSSRLNWSSAGRAVRKLIAEHCI